MSDSETREQLNQHVSTLRENRLTKRASTNAALEQRKADRLKAIASKRNSK